MDYDLYHDESQEGGYWHGILLVPQINKENFLNCLKLIREEVGYCHPIAFKGLKQKGRKFNCIKSCLQLGVGSLMQYYKNEPYIILTEKRNYSIDNKRQCVDYKKILVINSDRTILDTANRTILDTAKNDIQKEVSFPIKEIINKQQTGYKRMKNSRWFGSFCMSECWIENDKWVFGDFKSKNNEQIKLL